MNPDQNPLLDQLRDIHTVAEPSWWPPAPGWWVVGFLLFLLLAWLLQGAFRRWSLHRRKQAWLAAIDAVGGDKVAAESPREWLDGISRLFRAVALKAFPGVRCARMEGEEWVAFIRSMLPDNPDFESVAALAHGPWQPHPEFDSRALREAAREWVKRYG
jgi:hypothetical protein